MWERLQLLPCQHAARNTVEAGPFLTHCLTVAGGVKQPRKRTSKLPLGMIDLYEVDG